MLDASSTHHRSNEALFGHGLIETCVIGFVSFMEFNPYRMARQEFSDSVALYEFNQCALGAAAFRTSQWVFSETKSTIRHELDI